MARSSLISWLRTVVPALWGAVVTWLVTRGWVDAELAATLGEWTPGITAAMTAVAAAAWYAVARWLEDQLPPWLTRLLLGSARQPIYLGSGRGVQ